MEVGEEVLHLNLEFIGYHFYDPLKGKYVNVGMSNKTGWLSGWYGQFDEAGTVLTYQETIVDPDVGEEVNRKGAARLTEKGYVYENLLAAPSGEEWTTRRAVYERKN